MPEELSSGWPCFRILVQALTHHITQCLCGKTEKFKTSKTKRYEIAQHWMTVSVSCITQLVKGWRKKIRATCTCSLIFEHKETDMRLTLSTLCPECKTPKVQETSKEC